MSVLIEAKDGRADGTAFFPYEPRWNKRRMPVQVVDHRWMEENWQKLKAVLSKIENARVKSLLYLRQAIEGKSSDSSIVDAVVGLSESVQRSVANIDRDLREHGRDVTSEDGRPLYRVAGLPLVPGSDDAAAAFLIGLKDEPKALLAAEHTAGLASTKPCAWLDNNGQRQLGLFCPDTLSAIYATSILGFGIAACLRCGEVFLRHRSDDQFCSLRCQNTFLVARRRREQRAKRRTRKAKGRRT